MENICQLFYKSTIRNNFQFFRKIIMGWKHVSEPEKLLPPPSEEHAGKIDEVKNANFSFNRKSYVDALLQKRRVEERASERERPKNVIQKGNIVTQRSKHRNTLTTKQLCRDVTQ